MTTLPQPLTPIDCDLRDFAFMPLDVVRLRDSDTTAISSGDEFRCAVLLWCVAWHQVPAGSLPDDDIVLSQYAGFGRVIREWQKVRDGALRGWVKCSDSRLYHPVVAEKANEAWAGRLKHREKKEAERQRKAAERAARKAQEDANEAAQQAFLDAEHPQDNSNLSDGQTQPVQMTDLGSPAENALRGTVDSGEGQWTVDSGQLTSKTGSSSSQLPTTPPDEPPERENPNELPPMARNVQISLLLRSQNVQATSQNPVVAVTWAQNPKVTDEVLNVAIAKAKAVKPSEQIPVNYLARIVEQELIAQDAPPPEPSKPRSDDWAWKRSNQGIEAKGRELSMFARGGESYPDFAARIQAAIDKRKGA